MRHIQDPVLGAAEALEPRGATAFWGLCFLALTGFGVFVVVNFFVNRDAGLDIRFIFVGLLGLVLGPSASVQQLRFAFCRYAVVVSPRGFKVGSFDPISWADVEAVGDGTYRSRRVRLIVYLTRPRQRPQFERALSLYGLLDPINPPNVISIGANSTELPAEELRALFQRYFRAYQRATSQGATGPALDSPFPSNSSASARLRPTTLWFIGLTSLLIASAILVWLLR